MEGRDPHWENGHLSHNATADAERILALASSAAST
jgi:hypothetical protein